MLVRSPEARERLLPHLSPRNRVKAGSAPLVALLAVEADDDEAASSGWLQTGYFLVGVRAAGLAALPMGGFDRPEWTGVLPRRPPPHPAGDEPGLRHRGRLPPPSAAAGLRRGRHYRLSRHRLRLAGIGQGDVARPP